MSAEVFKIQGLKGKKTLQGEIAVGGAKNAALKAMVSTVLFSDTVVLKNVLDIEDMRRIADLMADIGMQIEKKGKNIYQVRAPKKDKTTLAPDIAKKLRSSIVLTGPLLARTGSVSFPHPGGCVIGARPIDLFLYSFEKLGAVVKEKKHEYILEVPDKVLTGSEIFLPTPSVTVTETVMMAATLAKGVTTIKNVALEHGIAHLAEF